MSAFPLSLLKSLEGDPIDAFGTSKTATCVVRFRTFGVPFLNRIRLVNFSGELIRVLGGNSGLVDEGTGGPESFLSESNGYIVRKYDDIVGVDSNENGSVIAAAFRSGAVKIFGLLEAHYTPDADVEPPTTRSWQFGAGQIRFIAVHDRAPIVAVGSVNSRVRIFNSETGALTHEFVPPESDQLTALSFHPTRLLLAAGLSKGCIIYYDLCRSCIICITTHGHGSAVTDIKFVDAKLGLPALSILSVSTSRDKFIKVFSLDDCASQICEVSSLTEIPFGNEETAEERDVGEQMSQKKKRRGVRRGLALQTLINQHFENGLVKIGPKIQLRTNEELESLVVLLKSHLGNENRDATWFVATGGTRGRLRLWDLLAGAEIPIEPLSSGFVPVSVPLRRLFRTPSQLTAFGLDGSVIFWDMRPRLRLTRSIKGVSRAAAFHALGHTKDSAFVFSSGFSGTLQKIWVTLTASSEITEISEPSEDAGYCCGQVTSTGHLVAVASPANGVKVFHSESGRLVAQIPAAVVGHVTKLLWNFKRGSNRYLFVLSKDLYIRVFKLSEPSEVKEVFSTPDHRVKVSEKMVYCFSLSPNDKILVTGGADKKISLWRHPSLEQIGVFANHTSPITAVTFSPIEQVVASAAMDMSVKVWNAKTLETIYSLSGLEASVNVLLFHRDGIHLIGGQSDGTLKFWDTKTAELIGSSLHHSGSVTSCEWVPRSSLQRQVIRDESLSKAEEAAEFCLITCSDDGAVCIWADETEHIKEKELETERERRNDVNRVSLLVQSGEFCEALKLALKWRRLDLFETVVKALKEASKIQSAMCLPNIQQTQQVEISDSEILFLFEQFKEIDLELILMAAIHFGNYYKGSHFAQWLVSLVISQAHRFKDLRNLEGFVEFVKSFTVKSRTSINRVESLKEKSFLIDILLNESGSLL
eukprot:Gregarina_sp_Poly_1__3467@NODE_2005_length_2877_cov_29_454804_g1295_i0_p1_GENE_NODE_2005_length_2877_cov_29_454804_g1295_i0NODE_2005_length_2877_cov_29_454804_g1295_i0_p1_ORF_typecomplete_len927_score138_41ANAPC4_WD40/PF12894_7/1_4e02ANAPC4_WD40/PF12894_7/0_0025ANAPC4_WD40/PF12894_7/0_0018ANAPC4_WD40/PF12894_7/1_6e02ANAPC4_WD40/PF12894_7/0_011ANAPC4_WD40/PF12894_7/8_6e08ANAPC4_WD40/PF12894_7/1_6e06ANAPC4_WD40/PF12894_7/3_2e10ANAPC4_WD40/PF12894_7/88WD40/PF00400_32/2e03WD40/PF00400_32/1_2e03WD40/